MRAESTSRALSKILKRRKLPQVELRRIRHAFATHILDYAPEGTDLKELEMAMDWWQDHGTASFTRKHYDRSTRLRLMQIAADAVEAFVTQHILCGAQAKPVLPKRVA